MTVLGGAAGCAGDETRSPTDTTNAAARAQGANTPQSPAAPVAPAAPPVSRVVVLGTSLTAGLGLDPERAYPSLLQEKADSAGFGLQIVNAGLSGETSAGALRRASWVLDQPVDMVVLEVGANDGLRGLNPDSTYANLVSLIGMVRQQQPQALVALVQMEAPTNLGRAYTDRFHTAYVRAAADTKAPLLPFLLDGVAGNARLNQADGIHPNAEGSKRVAEVMWRALLPHFRTLPGGRAG